MSRVFTAVEICGEALGAIGAFPVTDTAPDPAHLRRALTWLDMLLAQSVGTGRMFSRVPATLSMSIVNGTQSYDLYTALGDDLPTDRIHYVIEAYLEDEDDNRTPLEIVTRNTFESVSDLAETGTPIRIHIDRLSSPEAPTLRIFPTPAATDTNDYTIKLVCQRYAPTVAPTGVSGVAIAGPGLHDLGVAWQRWLVVQLAHDLGSGPIHKLSEPSLNRFAGMAAEAKARLEAFENREHENTPPICEAWGT